MLQVTCIPPSLADHPDWAQWFAKHVDRTVAGDEDTLDADSIDEGPMDEGCMEAEELDADSIDADELEL